MSDDDLSQYDDVARLVREVTEAKGGVILIVFGGKHGSGFAAQLVPEHTLDVVKILRDVATQIELSTKDAP